MDETYPFDAFLSYRRGDGTFAARWLRRRIKAYRLPKELDPDGSRKLTCYVDRVFRRSSADFFEDVIVPSLGKARYLIVVVTPSCLRRMADGSPNWGEREVEAFLELGRPENIRVVVAGGDFDGPLPAGLHETFPNIDRADLTGLKLRRYLRRPWPPRPREELLSIVAALHGIEAEQMPALRQEEHLRRRRAAARVAVGSALAVLVLAGALVWAIVSYQRAREQVYELHLSQGESLLLSQPSVSRLHFVRALDVAEPPPWLPFLGQLDDWYPRICLARGPVGAVDARWFTETTSDRNVGFLDRPSLFARYRADGPDLTGVDDGTRVQYDPERKVLAVFDEEKAELRLPDEADPVPVPGGVVTNLELNPARPVAALMRSNSYLEEGTVTFWDYERLVVLPEILETEPLYQMAFSPDGRWLAATHKDLLVYDLDRGEVVLSVPRPRRSNLQNRRPFFTADSTHLLFGGAPGFVGHVRLSDLAHSPRSFQHPGLMDADVSPDGTMVATCGMDGIVQIRALVPLGELEPGQQVFSALVHPDTVMTARFSTDGKRVVTGCRDHVVRVWDLDSGKLVLPPWQLTDAVTTVAFLDRGRQVLAADADGVVLLRTLVAPEPVRAVTGWAGDIASTPGERILVLGERKGFAAFPFEGESPPPLVRTEQYVHPASDGSAVLVRSDTELERIDVATGRSTGRLPFHMTKSVVDVSPGARKVLAKFDVTDFRVFDVDRGTPLGPVITPPDDVDTRPVILLGPNGDTLWQLVSTGLVRRWDAATGALLAAVQVRRDPWEIRSMGFSPDGSRWAFLPAPSELCLHDASTLEVVTPVMFHPATVNDVAFAADGKLIAVAAGRAVHLWDARSGRRIGLPLAHDGTVREVASFGSGHRLAARTDTTLTVWDVSLAGASRRTLELEAEVDGLFRLDQDDLVFKLNEDEWNERRGALEGR